jgi:hypothetical protein
MVPAYRGDLRVVHGAFDVVAAKAVEGLESWDLLARSTGCAVVSACLHRPDGGADDDDNDEDRDCRYDEAAAALLSGVVLAHFCDPVSPFLGCLLL